MDTSAQHLPLDALGATTLDQGRRGSVLHLKRAEGDLVLRWLDNASALEPLFEIYSRTRHPALILPTHVGIHPSGGPWVARPFADGATLAEVVPTGRDERWPAWTAQWLGALDALHSAGWIHRDIKQANLLIGPGGAKLFDLDLASDAGHQPQQAGTRTWIAPEILSGQPADARSDLFGLGASLARSLLGAGASDFATRFPAEDFWSASRLDPVELPAALRALLTALVQRDPAARPATARRAASLLPAQAPLERNLVPPPLLGRAEALLEVARSAQKRGRSLVVIVDDASDHQHGLMTLAYAAALEGRPAVERRSVREEGAQGLRALDRGVGSIVGLAPDADGAVLAESLAASALPGAATFHGVCTEAQADAARSTLGRADLATLVWHPLGAVPLEAMEGHLLGVTSLSSARAVRKLARDLHRKSEGQQARLESALARCVELEVARDFPDGWSFQRDTWPAERAEEKIDLTGLSPAQQGLLSALCDAPAGMASQQILGALSLQENALEPLMKDLAGRGLTLIGRERPGAAWHDQVRASLPRSVRRSAAKRLLDALKADGAPLGDRLRLAGLTGDDPSAMLEYLHGLRREGRLSAARAMADQLEDRHHQLPSDAQASLAVLRAQLDMAQGSPDLAKERLIAVLKRSVPESLAEEAELTLADAHQRAGDYPDADAIYRRITGGDGSPETKLRAEVGAAHVKFLMGDYQGALAQLPSVLPESASAETRGGAHNLRGGALIRMGRPEPAREEFHAAYTIAREDGDRGLAARSLLNRAVVERNAGAFQEAEEALEAAARLAAPTDLLATRAMIRHNLGTLLRDRGDLAKARRSLEGALRLRRRAGDAYGIATTCASLAIVELEQGIAWDAAEQLRHAAELLRAKGHRAEHALAEAHLGMAAALGRHPARDSAPGNPEQDPAWARTRCLQALAADDLEGARRAAESGTSQGPGPGGIAEQFRCAALAHALAEDPLKRSSAAETMACLADNLGPARKREAAFRDAPPGAVEGLRQACGTFRRDGRIDLEWSAAKRLVQAAQAAGDGPVRRRAAQRADHLAEVLTRGIQGSAARGAFLEDLGRTLPDPLERLPSAPGEALGLEWFSLVNRQLASADNLDNLLQLVLDRALECTGAKRGLLLVETGEALDAIATRGLEPSVSSDGDLQLSGSLVRRAMDTGEAILTQDIAADPRFSEAASVASLNVRAILCVPIMDSSGAFGALYVDDDRTGAVFDASDSTVLACLAEQAGAVARQLIARSKIEELNALLAQRVELQHEELVAVRTQLRRSGNSPATAGLIGESPVIEALKDQLRRLATTDLPVLVTGPSGSGKELVARALYALGTRREGPFVVENMAALSESLMESEFFGHARGAFTGADSARKGLFEEAHGGTLFLDEIADLHLTLQAKLLRVLESGEFRRVGDSATRHADVRLVAATNANLEERVSDGTFRRDLYYRLNAAELTLPSLAERAEDIPLLVEHFLELLAERYQQVKPMGHGVTARLVDRPWPGEVRELKNEVERLYLLSGNTIEDTDLVRPPTAPMKSMGATLTLLEAEQKAIRTALERSGQNRAQAARLLGISRAGLYNKLKKLGPE